jgi:chemosensory pili system protein ChpA (sensor histidine kinase/response regulator)
MGSARKHFALDWIKSDLLETLDEARVALDDYAEQGGDETCLRLCLARLHQVHGTLLMLELKGVTLLADHLERTAQALVDGYVISERACAQLLMQGLLELPGYLDEIQRGGNDEIGTFLPLVNELRDHLGEPALDDPAGLSLSAGAPDDVVNKFTRLDGSEKVTRMRSAYQNVLLTILKGEDRADAVDTFKKIATGLQKLTEGSALERQWQAFGEFVASLGQKEGALDADAVKLLRRVDIELKSLATEGEIALRRPANMELMAQLLDATQEREYATGLTDVLREAVSRDTSNSTLAISGRQATTVAAVALREELAIIKDKLDLFSRASSVDLHGLGDLVAPLQQIGSTLSLLGFESSREIVMDQVSAIEDLVLLSDADPEGFQNVAAALAQVDENLYGFSSDRTEIEQITEEAQLKLLEEARKGLDQLKTAVVDFVSTHWDVRHLTEVPKTFAEIRGALDIIPLPRVNALLDLLVGYVERQLMNGHRPDWQELDRFADAVSGADYFLERLGELNAAGAEEVLLMAERATEDLLHYSSESEKHPGDESIAQEPENTLALDDLEFVADLPDQVADPESVEIDEWTLAEGAHVENEEFTPESLESHFDVAGLTFAEDEGAGGIPELELDVDDDPDVPDSSRIAEAQSRVSEAHNSLGDDAGAHAEKETSNREQWLDVALVSMEDENIALEKEGDEAFDLSSTVYADVDGRIERYPDERKVSGRSISTETEVGIEQTVLEGPAEQDEDAARPVDGRAAPPRPEKEHLRGDADLPDPEIVEIFVEEVEEVLENVALELPKWAAQFSDSDALAEVRRAFHTLKGSGRIVNAVTISELAWGVENMLNRVIEGTVEADDQFVQVVESACTAMAELLSSFQNGSEGDFEQVALLVDAADVLASGGDLDASFRSYAQASASDESSNSTAEALALKSVRGGELSVESDSPAISERSAASEKGDVLIDSPEAREPSAYELFIEEAGEHLVVLSAEMAQEPWHISDEIVRAFHTLRGSSVLVGCREVSAIVDPANLVVEAWREHTTHEPTRDFCLTAVEQLSDCLEALVNGVAWQGAVDLRTQADELLALALIEAEPSLLEASVIDDLFEAEEWIGNPIEHSERLLTTFSDFVQVAQAAEKENLAELGAALLHMLTIASVSEVLDVKRLRFGYELLLDQLNAMATGSVDGDAEQISAFISAVEASPEADSLAQPSETVLDQLEETMDDGPGELAGPDEGLEAAVEPATQSRPAVSFDSLDVDEDLVMVFFEEAEEISEEVESSIVSWSQEMENRLFLENLLRALHTLKGGARLCGLVELGDMAHDFESIVIDVQNEDRRVDAELFTELHTRHDAIVSHLTRFREALFETGKQEADLAVGQGAPGQAPDEALQSSLGLEEAEIVPLPSIEELTLNRSAEAPENTEEPTAAQTVTTSRAVESVQSERPQPRPSPPSVLARDVSEAGEPDKPQVERPQTEMVRVGASLLEELVNLAGENSIVRARIEQGMSDFTGALDEMETTIERLREQLRRLEIETETQILYRHDRLDGPDYENFDPLEMDRYSQLQQLSRGLSESASDMLDLKETLLFKARESETLLLQQARINTELQEGLMRTRMVPFSRLIPRLRRTVRQVSGELGKDVEFHIQNAEGELDRNLLERMLPPLEHMLRNAVDHGIEAAEMRRNFGKPGPGRIDLCLSREGGDVVIEISDDGAGIDVESVREKAIERGLTSASAYLGDDETLQFILAPGFSTAKSVTQISGRGVGMDVVNSEVKQLGGSISIASQPGKGSRFVLRLPFTVSVNRALMVSVADDLYAIPLNNIEGIVLLGEDEIARLHEGGENTFEYAGVPYRVRYLGQYLGREYRGTQVGQTTVPLVLVHSGEHAVAVHVDAVQGSREIVVKSLGPQFAGVGGISGATILGDGNVVVILDLLALIRAQRDLNAQQIDRSAPTLGRPRSVLVVDDSVTVRKVTSRLLERQGMDVLVAKDGVEAVALLQEQRPDVMLLDIEMPRMDGFEVARQVRHDERLENLPIVMVSSRTGDKHKEHASQLGVDRFLGKPFQENELLATIDELVTRT